MSNVMSIQERLAVIKAGKAKVEENEGKGAKNGGLNGGKSSGSPLKGSPVAFAPNPATNISTPLATPQIGQMAAPTLADKLAGLVSNNIANGNIGKAVQDMPKLAPVIRASVKDLDPKDKPKLSYTTESTPELLNLDLLDNICIAAYYLGKAGDDYDFINTDEDVLREIKDDIELQDLLTYERGELHAQKASSQKAQETPTERKHRIQVQTVLEKLRVDYAITLDDIAHLEEEVDDYRQKLNRRDERIRQLEAIVQLDKVRRKDVEARLAKLEGML